MAKGALICAYCQRPIESNPYYEVQRISGKLLILKSRQVFPFHTRKEIKAWIEGGQKAQSQTEESEA